LVKALVVKRVQGIELEARKSLVRVISLEKKQKSIFMKKRYLSMKW
jgi:hypothetical protein